MSLGRGLESLIPKKSKQGDDAAPAADISSAEPPVGLPAPEETLLISETTLHPISQPIFHHHVKKKMPEAIFNIEVDKIKPNPHQPRRDFDEESLRELAQSIREYGILQPIVVSKIETETDTGTDVYYQLIAGERRLMAVKMLGWERVPAIIRSIDTKSEGLELAVVENLQRTDLNPIETARAYAKLQDEFNLTQREIATRLGKSRETVANTLRLLNLPTEIQEALVKNQLNESQARLLLVVPDLTEQQIIFQDLLNKNLSVRELKSRIKKEKTEIKKDGDSEVIDPQLSILQEQLTELLGAKVKIKKTGNAGQIIIDFYSPEEIQGFIQKLKPDDRLSLWPRTLGR